MMTLDALSSHRTVLVAAGLMAGCFWPFYAMGDQADSPSATYVRKATWPETMVATSLAIREQLGKAETELGPWYTTGPIAVTGFSEAAFLEQEIRLNAQSQGGRPLWQACPD